MGEVITTRNNRLWLDDDAGIARGRPVDGAVEDGVTARENLDALRRLVGDHPRPFLVDIRGAKTFGREARELYASAEPVGVWTAVAILVASTVTRTMANFFFTVNRPKTPSRMFTDEAEAVAWLQQYRR